MSKHLFSLRFWFFIFSPLRHEEHKGSLRIATYNFSLFTFRFSLDSALGLPDYSILKWNIQAGIVAVTPQRSEE